MEKRLSKLEKVLIHFDEIIEEKLTLEDNLKMLIAKVCSYVEHVKKSNQSMRQTHIYEVLKYELEILTKVTDMNSELENLLELSPIDRLDILENSSKSTVLENMETNSKNNEIPSGSSRDLCNKSIQNSIYETPSDHVVSATAISFSTNDSTEYPIDQKNNLTENELQTIRNSLRNFSLKLGLNEESFCEKPSTDCVGKIENIPPLCVIVPESVSDSDSLELPVRDASTSETTIKSIDNHNTECTLENCSKCNYPNIDVEQSETSIISVVENTTNKFENCHMYNTENISDVESSHFESCTDTSQSTFRTPVSSPEESKDSAKSSELNNQNSQKNSVLTNKKENLSKRNSPSKRTTGKRKNSEIFELLPKKTPLVGDECMFSHIVSPSEFYIHILDDETVSIDDLAKRIHQNYNKSVPTHTSKRLAFSDFGRFCLAFVSKYNSWFRAEVLNWYLDEQSDDVLIQLVDYGIKQNVSYQNLRKMAEELANVPKLAVRCHFPMLYTPSSTRLNRSVDWPEASIKALVDVSGTSEHEEKQDVTFKIVYAFQEPNSLAVDLYNPLEENEELTVGQILLDLGFAKQILEECDEEHMELEVFLDDIDQLETADNINEAIAGYDARDEARICRFTRKDGTCFKGKHCKLEHGRLSKDGFTLDTELIFKEAMYSLSLPACGESVTVLVTCYIDICRFFVQIVYSPHREPKYVIDRDLYSLLADLNSPRLMKTYESFKILPAVGEIVLVKHWTKKWLRAVVRELVNVDLSETTEIHVFTVDVGETLKVNLKDLRKIQPHLLKVPFQAVECYIHDYKMRDDCSPEKAKAFFDRNLYFHNFSAVVMSSCPPIKISLRSMNAMTDIGKKLEEQNFAEARMQDNNPSDDCLIKLH